MQYAEKDALICFCVKGDEKNSIFILNIYNFFLL